MFDRNCLSCLASWVCGRSLSCVIWGQAPNPTTTPRNAHSQWSSLHHHISMSAFNCGEVRTSNEMMHKEVMMMKKLFKRCYYREMKIQGLKYLSVIVHVDETFNTETDVKNVVLLISVWWRLNIEYRISFQTWLCLIIYHLLCADSSAETLRETLTDKLGACFVKGWAVTV